MLKKLTQHTPKTVEPWELLKAPFPYLVGAPDYVLSAWKHPEPAQVRYTVAVAGYLRSRFMRPNHVDTIIMSDLPTSPEGISLWDIDAVTDLEALDHQRIEWAQLPGHIQFHVIRKAAQCVLCGGKD